MYIVSSSFHFASTASISSDIGGMRIRAGATGYVMWGPYVPLNAGIYRLRPKLSFPTRALCPQKARFDVYMNQRVVCEGELRGKPEILVRVPDTMAFEFRLKSVAEDLIVHGLEVEEVLLDRDMISPDRAVALASELIDGSAPLDVVLSIRDRLIGLGEAEKASLVEEAGISRIRTDFSGFIQFTASARAASGERHPNPDPLKIVDFLALDEEKRAILEGIGCIPSFIEATRLARSPTQSRRGWQRLPGQLSPGDPQRVLLDMYQSEVDFAFQDQIALGEGVTAYCPWTGERLTSKHGFIEYSFSLPYIFYRFKGREVFYLCVGGSLGTRMFIYLPSHGLVVSFEEIVVRWYDLSILTQSFSRKMSENAAAVTSYLEAPTRVAAVHGHNNMGHFCWNDLAGLQHAGETGLFDHVEETVELHRQFFPVRSLFPELAGKPSAFFNDPDEAFKHGLARNLLPVRFTNAYITNVLAKRIEATAKQLASDRGKVPDDLTGPLIWINLRAHNKVWIDQTAHYANIFNALYDDYGNLVVFLDGLADCAELAEAIKARTKPAVRIFDGLGLPLLDSVNWANAADTFVAPIGSGLVLANWLANKPGVAHAEHAHMDQLQWWNTVRESGVPPSAPQLTQIRDVGTGIYCNYELDGSVVLALLREILDRKFSRGLGQSNALRAG